jgi:hypothetical protein
VSTEEQVDGVGGGKAGQWHDAFPGQPERLATGDQHGDGRVTRHDGAGQITDGRQHMLAIVED